jgi:hypothetical protein
MERDCFSLVSYPCVRRWMQIPATREQWSEASLDRAATAGGSAPDMLSSHEAADGRARHDNRALQGLRAGDANECLPAIQLLSQSPRSGLEVERGPSVATCPSVVTWWSAHGKARETSPHHSRALTSSTVYARIHPSIVTWSLFVPPSTRLGAQSAGAGVLQRRERKEVDKRHAETAPPPVHPPPQDQLLGCGGSAQQVHSDSATQEKMPDDGGDGEGVCAGSSSARQASPVSTCSSMSSPSLVTQLCVPLVFLEPASRCVCLVLHCIALLVWHHALSVARGKRQASAHDVLQLLTSSSHLDRSASSVSLASESSPDSFVLSPDHRGSEQGGGQEGVQAGGWVEAWVPGFPEHQAPKGRGGRSAHPTAPGDREPGDAESQGARGQLARVVACGDMPSVITWWPSASVNRQRRSAITLQKVTRLSVLKQPSVVTWWSAQVGSLTQKPPAPPRRPQSLKLKPPAPPGKHDKPAPPPRR